MRTATEITDWDDLDEIRNEMSGDYVLVNDLDANIAGYDTHVTDPDNGWDPIGGTFSGTLDGNGHEISDLVINRPEQGEIGLFAENDGTVKQLSVVDCDITGDSAVGSLIGINESNGIISSCSATGSVSANEYVGGLIGSNNGGEVSASDAANTISGGESTGGLLGYNYNGTVTKCYATGTVDGTLSTGGLVGTNTGTVSQAYATGGASGTQNVGGLIGQNFDGSGDTGYATGPVSGDSYVGGVVGSHVRGEQSSSYWDIESTGQQSGVGDGDGDVTGLQTAEMKGKTAKQSMGAFDFENVWVVTGPENYPRLRLAHQVIEIEDWNELRYVQEYLEGDFRLARDLDRNTPGYDQQVGNPDAGWEPLGASIGEFAGSLSGNGYKIADLVIDRPDESDIGLIESNDGKIDGVTLANHNVTGNGHIGGLVGLNSGTVTNCSIDGTVNSNGTTGGLIGSNSGGIISGCSGSVTVSGGRNVGGLIGSIRNGTVSDCSVSGDISGGNPIGGIIGAYEGDVTLDNSHYDVTAVNINGEQRLSAGGLFSEQYQDWKSSGKSLNVADYESLNVVDTYIEIADVQGIKDALGFTQQQDNNWQLTADIDLTNVTYGLYIPHLAGAFDGNGHTITVDISQPEMSNIGFIGYNAGGEVTDLHVEGTVTGFERAGGLMGANRNGTVRACSANTNVTGDFTTGDQEAAGGGTIGGLIGQNLGTVRTSHADGPVNGFRSVGGLVGENSGTVSTNYATGAASGETNIGGLVGNNYDGTVKSSYATGAPSGDMDVGGLIGNNYNGTVKTSYATGTPSGNTRIGGLVGNGFNSEIGSSYWDTESTGQQTGIGEGNGDVTGLQTAEMQGQTPKQNMPALDFEQTWIVLTDPDDYPQLQFQGTVPSITASVDSKEISPGGVITIAVDASDHTSIEISKLWADWEVNTVETAGGTVDVSEGETLDTSTVTITWDGEQSLAQPTLEFSLPQRYIGGEYQIDAIVTNETMAAESTATFSITN
ncbi:hypothetical protein HZS55_06270 [Halosimplex rubrum]|uniref:GLUG domain-containing protein n=1 Tax=Halosimplex rubrum TaxID=869889 RepID=A0A7D5NZ06_9EURY|nr:GLUG motif-containing protein [Halosimplex rubrum]QLH76923.1 hypothetical protein HZS55_06270 [Halosimplex rubrum]